MDAPPLSEEEQNAIVRSMEAQVEYENTIIPTIASEEKPSIYGWVVECILANYKKLKVKTDFTNYHFAFICDALVHDLMRDDGKEMKEIVKEYNLIKCIKDWGMKQVQFEQLVIFLKIMDTFSVNIWIGNDKAELIFPLPAAFFKVGRPTMVFRMTMEGGVELRYILPTYTGETDKFRAKLKEILAKQENI